jgi:ABC-2 type transport system permease protein
MGGFWHRTRLIAWKESLQLLRDRSLLPILLIAPVLQLLMFGYVVGAEVRQLPTAFVDEDHSAYSRTVLEAFRASGYFTIVTQPATEGEIQPLMDGNKVGVAVIVPQGFGNAVAAGRRAPLEVVVDGTDSQVSQVANQYSSQIIANLSQQLYPASAAVTFGLAGIDSRVRVLFNPSLASVNVMVPGLMAFILLLSTSAVMSQAVVKERERGTLEQLFVTPISRSEYLLGKVAPYILVASCQVAVVFAVGILWFRVPFNGSLWVIGIALFLFMLTAIGQGLLISTLSRTRQQAQQLTTFILLPTMILSGFIFPIESMPALIQPITYLTPMRYIVIVMRAAFLKGAGFEALWPEFLAMIVFGVAIFGIAVARIGKRLAE